jgi:hypothetical protein
MIALGVLLGKGSPAVKAQVLFEIKDFNSDQKLGKQSVRQLCETTFSIVAEYILSLVQGDQTRGFVSEASLKHYNTHIIANYREKGGALALEKLIYNNIEGD